MTYIPARRSMVTVHFDTCDLPNVNQSGEEIQTPGVIAECLRCHHEVTSFGQHEAAFKRCCALLRQECPKGESNFYTYEGRSDNERRENDAENTGVHPHDWFD